MKDVIFCMTIAATCADALCAHSCLENAIMRLMRYQRRGGDFDSEEIKALTNKLLSLAENILALEADLKRTAN